MILGLLFPCLSQVYSVTQEAQQGHYPIDGRLQADVLFASLSAQGSNGLGRCRVFGGCAAALRINAASCGESTLRIPKIALIPKTLRL